jgi:hypothetical protein
MIVAFVVVAPLLVLGNAFGADFVFHLSSWRDVAQQWHQGVLYPRWAEWANYGFGEPRFIFYPPGSWMLGGALGWILPWEMVPGVFVWLVLTLAGVTMFRLAREWMDANEATCAAVLYVVNPYQLVVVYSRSAYAELFASAVFPLVVLYAVRHARDAGRTVVPLALVFAAAWLTNAPAAVITTYSLMLLLVVLAVIHRSARMLLSGGAAMALGFLLASFYILPAAYEQRWVNITSALSPGLSPGHNFLFTSVGDPEDVAFNLIISTIAAVEIGITGLAVVASNKPGHPLFSKVREFRWMLLALGTVSVALMFPVTSLVWRYLPELRFVQFPWRWLVPLGVVFAFLVAAAMVQARARLAWGVLMVVTLVVLDGWVVRHAWYDPEEGGEVMRTDIARGFEGTDEYEPRGADASSLPPGVEPVVMVAVSEAGDVTERKGLAHVEVESWKAEEKLFRVDTPQPVKVALRLLNYPAWQVEVDGVVAAAESQEDNGQMIISLPSGRHRVRVKFTRTVDRTMGAVLSGIASVFLLCLAAGRRGWGWAGKRSQKA